jgi:hypothetical protein
MPPIPEARLMMHHDAEQLVRTTLTKKGAWTGTIPDDLPHKVRVRIEKKGHRTIECNVASGTLALLEVHTHEPRKMSQKEWAYRWKRAKAGLPKPEEAKGDDIARMILEEMNPGLTIPKGGDA